MKKLLIFVILLICCLTFVSAEEINDELINALAEGDLDKVKEFHAKGVDLMKYYSGSADSAGSGTPLSLACEYGHVKLAKYLIDLGADVNQGTYDGIPILVFSIRNEKTEIAKLLIENGANPNIDTNHLHYDYYTYYDLYPLMAAYEANQFDLIIPLIKHGAIMQSIVIKGVPTNYDTLIHKTIKHNHFDIAYFLINRAPYDIRCHDLLPLVDINEHKLIKLITRKIKEFDYRESIMKTINNNDFDKTKELIESSPGNYLSPLLVTAIKRSDLKLLKLLVDNGADIHITNHDDQNLIQYALLASNHFEIVWYLYSIGVPIINTKCMHCHREEDYWSYKNITKLMIYSALGLVDAVKKELTINKDHINYTVNPIHTDNVMAKTHEDYITALDFAIEFGHFDVVKLLIKHGANPDELHKALQLKRYNIFKYLLHHGADPNMYYSSGYRRGEVSSYMFDEVLPTKNIELISLMLDKGTYINNSRYKNAIYYIGEEGNEELLNEMHERKNTLFPSEIKANSYLMEGENHLYLPGNVYDLRPGTSYSEGLPGNGIGTSFEFLFSGGIECNKLIFYNGFLENPKFYHLNGRVKQIQLATYNDSQIIKTTTVDIKDVKDKQIIDLAKDPLSGNKIVMTITDVYPGMKYNDTCFSEINFIGQPLKDSTYDNRSYNKRQYNRRNITEQIKKSYTTLQNKKATLIGTSDYSLDISIKNNDIRFSLDRPGNDPLVYSYKYSLLDEGIQFYPQDHDNPLDTAEAAMKLKSDQITLEFTTTNTSIQKIIDEIIKLESSEKRIDELKRNILRFGWHE